MFIKRELYTIEEIRDMVLEDILSPDCSDSKIVNIYCQINRKYGYINEEGKAVIQEQ